MGDDNAGFSRESFGGKGGTQQNPSKNVFSHAFWCFPSIRISIRCSEKGKKQLPTERIRLIPSFYPLHFGLIPVVFFTWTISCLTFFVFLNLSYCLIQIGSTCPYTYTQNLGK
jgi:hypothetical protein